MILFGNNWIQSNSISTQIEALCKPNPPRQRCCTLERYYDKMTTRKSLFVKAKRKEEKCLWLSKCWPGAMSRCKKITMGWRPSAEQWWMEPTNVNKRDLCHFTDEYESRCVSTQRRALVLGWCVHMIHSQTRASSNLQRRAVIYHLPDVGAYFPSTGAGVWGRSLQLWQWWQTAGPGVVPCDLRAFNSNLWINMSDVVRYGLLG